MWWLIVVFLSLPKAAAVTLGVLWDRDDPNNDGLSLAVEHAASSATLLFRQPDESVETAMSRMQSAAGDLIGFVGPRSSGEARFAERVATLPVVSPTATAVFLSDAAFFRRIIPSDERQAVAVSWQRGEKPPEDVCGQRRRRRIGRVTLIPYSVETFL